MPRVRFVTSIESGEQDVNRPVLFETSAAWVKLARLPATAGPDPQQTATATGRPAPPPGSGSSQSAASVRAPSADSASWGPGCVGRGRGGACMLQNPLPPGRPAQLVGSTGFSGPSAVERKWTRGQCRLAHGTADIGEGSCVRKSSSSVQWRRRVFSSCRWQTNLRGPLESAGPLWEPRCPYFSDLPGLHQRYVLYFN